jgi:ATP-dependent Clp protease adaptor protein ClpS
MRLMQGSARAAVAPDQDVEIDVDLDLNRLTQARQLRPHKVVVLDCQCHSFDDVELALCHYIPRMTRAQAHVHATEVHTTGASVVATAPREAAEHYAAGLRSRGLRVRIESDT